MIPAGGVYFQCSRLGNTTDVVFHSLDLFLSQPVFFTTFCGHHCGRWHTLLYAATKDYMFEFSLSIMGMRRSQRHILSIIAVYPPPCLFHCHPLAALRPGTLFFLLSQFVTCSLPTFMAAGRGPKIRVERWVVKLNGPYPLSSVAWRKNRNAFAALLTRAVEEVDFREPFDRRPPGLLHRIRSRNHPR